MPTLIEQFLSSTNFQLAWEQVASNQGCAGVDGETISHFAQQEQTYLQYLREALQKGTYRPLPLRQLFIPKSDGGWRNLAVPTVRDRVIQQALLQVLHPVMERGFSSSSFAYRPGRGHHQAVRQVAIWRDRGYEWVLDGDIIQYFDSVQHPRLLAEFAERLNHSAFIELIEEWLSVGVLTQQGLVFPQKGLPQGAVISPILANIYLDDFDKLLSQSDLKLVRYADDFLVLSRSQKRLVQATEDIQQMLTSIGLQLHPKKTHITNFDRGFRFLGQAFTGDLVVPVNSPKNEKIPQKAKNLAWHLVHEEKTNQPTTLQRALVEALKVAEQPIPPPLFVVLGYAVRLENSVVITSKEEIWHPNMATIYLVEQGTTLRKKQGRFVFQAPKETEIEVPIREVERILVFGNIQLTTTVISSCLEAQIPVIFLTQLGEYKGQLWCAENADLVLETAQFDRRQDMRFQFQVAQELVRGKLWNSKQLLLRLNRKRRSPEVAEAVEGITADLAALDEPTKVTNIDQIRGYEGIGAARYFSALGQLIVSPGFCLTERVFHPPTNPMNSLLSFGYSQLLNNVFSLLLAEGLNPYLGNLHRAERQEAYLAFDLMEEFRSPIVDTLVMKLVNQKIFKPTDFNWPTAEGGIYLTDSARRVFLKHFEERMSLKLTHPDIKEPVSYRRIIQLQVQRYKRCLLNDDLSYKSFLRVI